MHQVFLIALVSIAVGVMVFPFNSLTVFVVIVMLLNRENEKIKTPQKVVIFPQRRDEQISETVKEPVLETIKEPVLEKEQKKITSLNDIIEPIDYLKDIEYPDMSEAVINEDALAWSEIECR